MAAVRGCPETPPKRRRMREIVPISQKGQRPIELWRPEVVPTQLQQISSTGVGSLYIEFTDGEITRSFCGTCQVVDDDRGVLLTANHILDPPNDSFNLVRITVCFDNDQRGVFVGNLTCIALAHRPFSAGDPDPILNRYWTRTKPSDYVFLQVVNNWVPRTCVFVPGDSPAVGAAIELVGFPGQPDGKNYDKVYKNVPGAPALGSLQQMFLGGVKVATTGSVRALSNRMMAHTVPTWVGVSGGACVDPATQAHMANNIVQFCAIHVGSPEFDGSTLAKLIPHDVYNLAVCTTHPDFVLDYVDHVIRPRATQGFPPLPVASAAIQAALVPVGTPAAKKARRSRPN